MFINAGARVRYDRPKTKGALREALKTIPSEVYFDVTDAFGPNAGRTIPALDLLAAPELVVTVTGPDPYTKRNWYASVAAATDHLVVK